MHKEKGKSFVCFLLTRIWWRPPIKLRPLMPAFLRLFTAPSGPGTLWELHASDVFLSIAMYVLTYYTCDACNHNVLLAWFFNHCYDARGATGVVHELGQVKTTITQQCTTASAAMFYFCKIKLIPCFAGLNPYGTPDAQFFYLVQPHIKKCQNSNRFLSKKGTKTTMSYLSQGVQNIQTVLTSNSKSVLGLSLTVLVKFDLPF